jgi:uncharacterized membrane protein YczE
VLGGFLLGGTVGIGTLLYALAIGPITHHTIPALAIRPDPSSAAGRALAPGTPCRVPCRSTSPS